MCKWSIAVHGGAWAIPDDLVKDSEAGCRKAVLVGAQILQSGGSALDAVEAAVRVLEDEPVFDAGIGSVLNEDGEIEMDALIMDGKAPIKCGAVACVKRVRHPITLARRVMEETKHVLLCGEGADRFAEQLIKREQHENQEQRSKRGHRFQIEPATHELLETPLAREQWIQSKNYSQVVNDAFNHSATIAASTTTNSAGAPPLAVVSSTNSADKDVSDRCCDTVGVVALDINGDLASGTSTGGISFKKPGRVGDSPMVGSGGFADNEIVAVSVTGHGESIARVNLSARVAFGIESLGLELNEAVTRALEYMKKKVGGCGGIIAVSPNGEIAMKHTTERMAFASCSGSESGEAGDATTTTLENKVVSGVCLSD